MVHRQSARIDSGRLQAGWSRHLQVSTFTKKRKSRSRPFAIPAREGHLVFVTAEDQIKEVENSPIDQLSFHEAMEDVSPTQALMQ